MCPEREPKIGWMVTVAVVRDNGAVGHEVYAVGIDDPNRAVRSALEAANSETAVINGKMDETSMRNIGLKLGALVKVLDEKTDPLTSGAARH